MYPVLSVVRYPGSITKLEKWSVLVVSIELTVRVLTVTASPNIVLAVRVLVASVLKNPRTPMMLLVVIVELFVRVLNVPLVVRSVPIAP